MDFVSNSLKWKMLGLAVVFMMGAFVFLSYDFPVGASFAIPLMLFILSVLGFKFFLKNNIAFKIEGDSIIIKHFGKIREFNFKDLQDLKCSGAEKSKVYYFIFKSEKHGAFSLVQDENTENMLKIFFETFYKDFYKRKCSEFENTSRNLAVPKKAKLNTYITSLCILVFGFAFIIPLLVFSIWTALGVFFIGYSCAVLVIQTKLFRKAEKNVFIDKDGLHVGERLIPFAEITAFEYFQKFCYGELVCFKTNSETYVFPMACMQGDFVYQSYLMEKIKKQEVDSE